MTLEHTLLNVSRTFPWKIEYARRNDGRERGSTLVIHPAGGAIKGQVLVLDVGANRLVKKRVAIATRE
jgi:hypothetical protein